MNTAKRFTNFTKEDYTGVYDKVEYLVKVGETIMLPSHLADHFAKHLIDRELNERKKSTNSPVLRNEMEEKCLGSIEIKGENKDKLETEILNEKEKEEPEEEVKEEKFAGLEEEKEDNEKEVKEEVPIPVKKKK